MKFFTAVILVCIFSKIHVIAQPCTGVNIVVTFTTEDVDCVNNPVGNITSIVSGGTAPYEYHWNTGSIGNEVNTQLPGSYCVTVTDVDGCSVLACDTIYGPPAVLTYSLCPIIPQCHGDCVNIIDLTVQSGTPPYTFVWNDGATTEDRDSLCAGLYQVTTTDSNGCTFSSTHPPFPNPDSLIVEATIVNATCADTCDGQLFISIEGGLPPYEILLNSSQDTFAVELCSGIYPLVIEDAFGCVITNDLVVDAPLPLEINVIGPDTTSTSDTSTYNVSIIPNATYVWFVSNASGIIGGQGTNEINVQWLDTGTQSVVATIIDSDGCNQSSDTFQVYVFAYLGNDAITNAVKELFSIYPNPVGKEWLNVVSKRLGGSVLNIYNVDGRLIDTFPLQLKDNIVERIDIANLSNGVYVAELRHQGVSRQRFVVAK